MSRRILTLHLEGQTGVNIDEVKYDQMKQVILDILTGVETVTFKDLTAHAKTRLKDIFNGSIL